MNISANISDIQKLTDAIQRVFQGRSTQRDVLGGEIARVVSLLEPRPPLTGTFTRNTHPCTRHLEAALRAGSAGTADLLALIAPVAYDLPWRYSYAKRDDAPGIENNIAFAEIIGPEAPFKSLQVCLGLTLIGPETLYPVHLHPAIEIYYVAAGTATWTADGVASENPPGTFILHPSNVVHAMQTHREPLLAVYSWSGEDVVTLSAYTLSAYASRRRLPVK